MRTTSFKIKAFLIGMLLAILTIISFNTFSQSVSYSDIMSISDIKTFKKVMLENNFTKIDEDDYVTSYGYNP